MTIPLIIYYNPKLFASQISKLIFLFRYLMKGKTKKIRIGLIVTAVLILIAVLYIFLQETVSAGRYQVTYYKGTCAIDPKSFSQGLGIFTTDFRPD
jgi:hypothetical protein